MNHYCHHFWQFMFFCLQPGTPVLHYAGVLLGCTDPPKLLWWLQMVLDGWWPWCHLNHITKLTYHISRQERLGGQQPFGFHVINSLRPRQNGRHFSDDTFKRIFLNDNVWISNKISLKFVPKGPINNIPALVQIMAWRRIGDKPLSEPMLTQFTDAFMRH